MSLNIFDMATIKRSLALLALSLVVASPGVHAEGQAETQEKPAPQAIAQNSESSPDVPDLSKSEYTRLLETNTKKIVLKLIDLERYSLNYKLNVAKQGRWKGWRYLVSQEANSFLCLSGAITGGVERYQNYETPKLLKRNVLENGNVLSFTGQIIGGAGAATEFSINLLHDLEARRDGYSPGAAKHKVMSLRQDIDGLLDDRQRMIKEMIAIYGNVPYIEVASAEEPVLADMRDLCLREFRDYHVAARRTFATQQTLYLIDVARNTTGAMSNRFGWDALRFGDRRNNFTSGVLQNVTGGLTVLNPFLSRGVGKLVGECHRFYIKDIFDPNPATVEKLNKDLDRLQAVAATPALEREDQSVDRCAIYESHEDTVRKRIDRSTKELKSNYLAAAENIVSGTIIGGAKISTGVLFDIAGKDYIHNGKRTNCYLAHANMIGICASSYSAFETMRIQITREFKRHQLQKSGQLPGQLIKARLAKLDDMQKSLSL